MYSYLDLGCFAAAIGITNIGVPIISAAAPIACGLINPELPLSFKAIKPPPIKVAPGTAKMGPIIVEKVDAFLICTIEFMTMVSFLTKMVLLSIILSLPDTFLPSIANNLIRWFSFIKIESGFLVENIENQILDIDEWCDKFSEVFEKWERRKSSKMNF